MDARDYEAARDGVRLLIADAMRLEIALDTVENPSAQAHSVLVKRAASVAGHAEALVSTLARSLPESVGAGERCAWGAGVIGGVETMGGEEVIMADPTILKYLFAACRRTSDGGAACIMVRTESRFDAYMDAIESYVIPSGVSVTVVPNVNPDFALPIVAGHIVLGVWLKDGRVQDWVARRFGNLIPDLGAPVP